MSQDPPRNDEPETPEARKDAALDSALNTLEDILQHRRVVSREGDTPPEPPPGETLPLLRDVVIPGEPGARRDDLEPEPLHLPPHDDLVRRLVSELDIIIESCVDAALAEAKKDLMGKLKNHLEIVLPEILDELERRMGDDEPRRPDPRPEEEPPLP
jgi:hypothetical protein